MKMRDAKDMGARMGCVTGFIDFFLSLMDLLSLVYLSQVSIRV